MVWLHHGATDSYSKLEDSASRMSRNWPIVVHSNMVVCMRVAIGAGRKQLFVYTHLTSSILYTNLAFFIPEEDQPF